MSSNIELSDLPEFLILAFLGSLFVVYISTVMKENTILETFGKYSLVVYLTHGLFLNLFIEFFNYLYNSRRYIYKLVLLYYSVIVNYRM